MVLFDKRQKLLLWSTAAVLDSLSIRHAVSSFQRPLQQFKFHGVPTKLQVQADGSPPRLPTAKKPSLSSETEKRRVVYQRVVKVPVDASGNGNPIFFGNLVEYLQDRFEIPDKLPVVYQSVLSSLNDNGKEGEEIIQSWNSPMSPVTESTRLDLQVVPIYTGKDRKQQGASVPSLAMVVVRKGNQQSDVASMPTPMLKNFFDESERLILKALEQGLENFLAEKFPMDHSLSQRQVRTTKNRENVAYDGIEEMRNLKEASKIHLSASKEDPSSCDQQSLSRNKNVITGVDAEKSNFPSSKTQQPSSAGVKVGALGHTHETHTAILDTQTKAAPGAPSRRDVSKPTTFNAGETDKGMKGNLDLSVIDENAQEMTISSKSKKQNGNTEQATRPPIQRIVERRGDKAIPSDQEISQTARAVMTELANESKDIAIEELLKDVLKFGDKHDHQAGSAFAIGVFDKAKELMRTQKEKFAERSRRNEADQADEEKASKSSPWDGIPNIGGPQVGTRVISSEEEELKRMFEAGERIADVRMSWIEEKSTKIPSYAGRMTGNDEKAVDDLIAGETGVSDHARILDDELAELEVRIRQSPDEEHDGPPLGKPFDILSGPEVYNRNNNPDVVNWPGALPGTKSIDDALPNELVEAVKQAKFAAEVLQQLYARELEDSSAKTHFVGKRELSQRQVESLQTVVQEAVEIGIIQNPLVLLEERSRLQMVLDEVREQPEGRFREIVSNYKDLLLSDNFVTLVKERLENMAERDLLSLHQQPMNHDKQAELEKAHTQERELLGQLVAYAQLLLKEARAIGAELEGQQIEVIRSICKVAMDPTRTTEEEISAALTDAVKDMMPLLDDMFVSYLKYAIAEEKGRLIRADLLDDPEQNQWLFILKIVQHGVYAEISKSINRYIEHIWYVLRMETAVERRLLLEKLVDTMPSLDVRPFLRVVGNIVGSLGEAARGEFDSAYELGRLTNKLLQLYRDVKEILPPERIDKMSCDADEWAARQRERMLEQRRFTKRGLKAARDTEQYDLEIESMGRGEMERFT